MRPAAPFTATAIVMIAAIHLGCCPAGNKASATDSPAASESATNKKAPRPAHSAKPAATWAPTDPALPVQKDLADQIAKLVENPVKAGAKLRENGQTLVFYDAPPSMAKLMPPGSVATVVISRGDQGWRAWKVKLEGVNFAPEQLAPACGILWDATNKPLPGAGFFSVTDGPLKGARGYVEDRNEKGQSKSVFLLSVPFAIAEHLTGW